MTKPEILPLGTNVYIELDAVQEHEGAIILPESHSEVTRIGTVREIGPDVTTVNRGDKVIIEYIHGAILHLPRCRKWIDTTKDTHRIVGEQQILTKIKNYSEE